MKTSYAEKAIEKARKDCNELAESYNVPRSSVFWMGNNKYIVIKDGKEIRI